MKKKRINGEGNIRKRSEHSWEASLRTEDGERLYVYGSTQKEVKEKLQGIRCGYKPTSCPDQLTRAIDVLMKS